MLSVISLIKKRTEDILTDFNVSVLTLADINERFFFIFNKRGTNKRL